MKIFGALRSERSILKEEILRIRAKMKTVEPGTEEYKMLESQLNDLMDRSIELVKDRTNMKKALITAFGGIIGMLLYRRFIDTSADPFFRDFGNKLLSCIKHV